MLISAVILSMAIATFEARRARLSPNVAPFVIAIAPLISASSRIASTTVETISSTSVNPARERRPLGSMGIAPGPVSGTPVEVQRVHDAAHRDHRDQRVHDRRH